MGFAASQARLLVLTARKSDLEYRAQQITNAEMLLAMQSEQIAKRYSDKISNQALRWIHHGETLPITASNLHAAGYGVRVVHDGRKWGLSKAASTKEPRKKVIGVSTEALVAAISKEDGTNLRCYNGETKEVALNKDGTVNTIWLGKGKDGGDYSNVRAQLEKQINNLVGKSFDEGELILIPIDFLDSNNVLHSVYVDASPYTMFADDEDSIYDYNANNELGQYLYEGIMNGTLEIVPVDKHGNFIEGAEAINIQSSTAFSVGYYTEDDNKADAEYQQETAKIKVKEKRLQMEMKEVESQQKACENEIESTKKIMDKNIDTMFKYAS